MERPGGNYVVGIGRASPTELKARGEDWIYREQSGAYSVALNALVRTEYCPGNLRRKKSAQMPSPPLLIKITILFSIL